jgi:hypothetical protein
VVVEERVAELERKLAVESTVPSNKTKPAIDVEGVIDDVNVGV